MAEKRVPMKFNKRFESPRCENMTKIEFIKSCPADMSAKEVIAKAKEAGIGLSAAYVYNVRMAAKAKPSRKNKAKATPKKLSKQQQATVIAAVKTRNGHVEKDSDQQVLMRQIGDLVDRLVAARMTQELENLLTKVRW